MNKCWSVNIGKFFKPMTRSEIVSKHLMYERLAVKNFANFSSFFKNTEIERIDIGDYMTNYSIENDLMKHLKKMLMSSFKLKIGTVISPLFKKFLEIVRSSTQD